MNKKSSSERSYEIDLFRFVAAMAVVLYHYLFFGAAHGVVDNVKFPHLFPVALYGYLGVDMFFMISGYVILLSSWGKRPTDFIISRVTRLYPAFWACVTITFIAITFFGTPYFDTSVPEYLANLTMLARPLGYDYVDGAYWSLYAELRFYFWAFVLVLFKGLKHVDRFLWLWMAMTIANHFFRLHAIEKIFVLDWSTYFIAGCVFYRMRTEGFSWQRHVLIIASFSMAITRAIPRSEGMLAVQKTGIIPEPAVIILALTLFYGLFYLVAARKTSWVNRPIFYHLGVITYPLYLIHQIIGYIVFNHFDDSINHILLIVLMTSASLLTAYLIHLLIEKPVAKWLKQLMQFCFAKMPFIHKVS